jgi:amidase
VQFAARLGEEATLLQLATQLEGAKPWLRRRPAVHVAAPA